MAQRMFGLQWIDRKYIAINSNTTPKNGENQNMKRIEFDDTGKEKILFPNTSFCSFSPLLKESTKPLITKEMATGNSPK